jgi:hypothetical protein
VYLLSIIGARRPERDAAHPCMLVYFPKRPSFV